MNSWLLGRGNFASDVRQGSVYFESDGLRIHAYTYCRGDSVGKPALIVCHGRTPESLELSGIARKIAEYGFFALNLEGRGRGKSEGGEQELWNEQGYLRDVMAAVDFTLGLDVDRQRVAIIGQSLGSGTAIIAAAHEPRLKACVALHPYSDYAFSTEPRPGDPDVRRPVDYVAQIAPRPLLIIAGEKDETLPVAGAHELYDAAGDPKRLLIVQDGTHSIEDTEVYALGWLLTNV